MRSGLFALVFYGLSVPVVLLTPLVALFGQRALIGYTVRWAKLHRWCARVILGIESRVEGAPAAGSALYAAKHQSMFETLELCIILNGPAIVLKRELARIPLWGWAAQRYGCIPVDRAGSAAALRRMMRAAERARESGRSVLIFPEGTRVMPGETPPLQPGFAGLYRALKLPVVPIALDSGRLWPRRGPKRTGVVTIRFGEEVPPGLPRRAVEAAVHRAINVLRFRPHVESAVVIERVQSPDDRIRITYVKRQDGLFAYLIDAYVVYDAPEEQFRSEGWEPSRASSGLFDSLDTAKREAASEFDWAR